VRYRPFGLSLSKPLLACHHPFGLTLRQAQDRVRFADRSLALSWPFSLREAASGCAPDRAVTFFRFPERKSPKKGGPDGGGRPRADCSAVLGVRGPRQTHFVRYAHCVQTNGAKSVHEACCARGPKPLRSSTPPTGPKSNTVVCFANFPCHTSLRIGCDGVAEPWRRCEARCDWCSSPPSDELSSTGLCGARASALRELTSRRLSERSERSERSELGAAAKTEQRKAALAQQGPRRQGSLLCLLSCRYKFAKRGSAHFAEQSYADTKGGRLPGRNHGAASRSEQDSHAHAGTNGAGLRSAAGGPCPEPRRRVSLNGGWCASKASTGSARTDGAAWRYASKASTSSARTGEGYAMTQHTQGAAPCPLS